MVLLGGTRGYVVLKMVDRIHTLREVVHLSHS